MSVPEQMSVHSAFIKFGALPLKRWRVMTGSCVYVKEFCICLAGTHARSMLVLY